MALDLLSSVSQGGGMPHTVVSVGSGTRDPGVPGLGSAWQCLVVGEEVLSCEV